nr:hypothetical protein [uncultured Capnocytophaga sp.]
MTQDQMKGLAQNFRDNVEKILPNHTPYNQNRIKKIKELNTYVNQAGRKVYYSYNSKNSKFIEKISMEKDIFTTKVIEYILDPKDNSVIDIQDISEKSF